MENPPQGSDPIDNLPEDEFPEEADEGWMSGGAEVSYQVPPDPRIAKAQVMVESAFLATTTALIWLVNTYIPLGPLLRMFFPLPIALAYLRWGKRAAWMTAIVTTLLLSVLLGPFRSIQFFLPYALLGASMGGFWRRGISWTISLGWGILLCTVGLLFQVMLLSLLLSTNLWRYLTFQVLGILDWILVQLNLLVEPAEWVVQLSAIGLIVVNAALYLLLVHLVASVLFERLGKPIPEPPGWLKILLDE
jgi:uncharacterized protein YybS (DUF2232 family)